MKETSENVFILRLVSFGVCIQIQYSEYFCDVVRDKTPKNKISTWVNQKKINSSSKEYVMWTWFKFQPMKKILRKL